MLGETIRQVKELKKAVAEVEANACHGHIGREDQCVVPSGADRLSLEHCEVEEGEGLMKAVLSCEDRAGLMSEMMMAVRAVKGKVVKAEMVTVGGRTKIVVWVKGLDGSGNEGMVGLRKALKVIVVRRVLQAAEINRKLRFVQWDL